MYRAIAITMILIMILVGCQADDMHDKQADAATTAIRVVLPYQHTFVSEDVDSYDNYMADETLEKALKDYQAREEVAVETLKIDANTYNDYFQKLSVLLMSEQPPDIVLMSSHYVNPFEKTLLPTYDLVPVSDYLANEEELFKPLVNAFALPIIMQTNNYFVVETEQRLPKSLVTMNYLPFEDLLQVELDYYKQMKVLNPHKIRAYLSHAEVAFLKIEDNNYTIDRDSLEKIIGNIADLIGSDSYYDTLSTPDLLTSLLDFFSELCQTKRGFEIPFYIMDDDLSLFDFRRLDECGIVLDEHQRLRWANMEHVLVNTDNHLKAIYAFVPTISKNKQNVYRLLNDLVSVDTQIAMMSDSSLSKYFHTTVSKPALTKWCADNQSLMLIDYTIYHDMVEKLDNQEYTKLLSVSFCGYTYRDILEQSVLYSRSGKSDITPYLDYLENKFREYRFIYLEQ